MSMHLGLTGRVYILSGSSNGLGYATAECLVAEGARVVLSGRDPERVAAAADRLGCVGLPVDNTDSTAADQLIDAALREYGRVDGGLISVGGPDPGPATSIADSQWRDAFDTVFLGSIRLARGLAGQLSEGGAIVFVLSTSVRSPVLHLAISNGLRPGLACVAKEMADELGQRGVRVVSLLPHGVLTDRVRQLHARCADPEAAHAATVAAIPLRRMGRAEEFGRVATFVLSPAASYLTGVAIPVDGGFTRSL